ncbi:Protein transport protein Sec16B, partial [Galemys pyrenaicus]
RPPQPQGRPTAPSKAPDCDLQEDGYRRPGPQSWHNGESFHQWQDLRGSSQPQQKPRADHQPHYALSSGEWHPSVSGVGYYEGGYPGQLYARPGIEDPYQRYYSPTLREDYAYGGYYYHGHPQELQDERVPRQGSPYNWHEDYRDQKYLSDQHRENRNSPFGTNSETQPKSKSWNPYKDSRASHPGQEKPGDLFPESVQSGAWKKLSMTRESNLLQQQESGLSNSSYELSQYMTDDIEPPGPMTSTAWSPIQDEDNSTSSPKAPMKFYIPHVPVSFGPGGQLVRVGPSSPCDGQIALVELHSMEVILNDSEEQEEMRAFSGPLIREDVHKVDIMTFCQQKAAQSRKSETPRSRDSALLWKLLVLLCRQNGSMVGSDIAELLMQDCQKLEKYKRQSPVANLISLTDEDWPVMKSGTPNLLTGEIPPSVETPAQIVEKFTQLLYFGRKKATLEWAMKNHLWGHALFLSSKMDPRTYNWVMSGFTSTLALNDPLQTLFQLMSGRIPQAATCCGDKQWGDWRPHLAVILSNQSGDSELHQRAIVTMGDTLAGKGLVEAAHFCYLMAHVPFGHYTVKTDHLALLGSSHSQEFLTFATTEAIQRTEIFEYCQLLGRPKSFIPSFQVYKLLYASRLADYGLASQALHYCEAIGTALLSQGESSHPVLLVELIKLAEKLKLSDPLLLERRRGDRDQEPDWLVGLRSRQEALQVKNTFYPDLSRQQGDSEALGDHSALWPTSEPTVPAQPAPQQSFPLLPGSYPYGGDAGQTGVPVPLYSVPLIHQPRTGGSVAVTGAPAGSAWEENQQMYPSPGEHTMSQETFQHLSGPKVMAQAQVPLIPGAGSVAESSTKEQDENKSSDETDKKASQSAAQKEKQGDLKENTKSSGFGWFSWFRSKPSNSSSSEDEDSSDSADSETSRAPSPAQASLGPSVTPFPESQPLPGTSTFPRGTGGGEVLGSVSSGGAADSIGSGGLSRPEGVSSEMYFNPGPLLPPPTFQGAVPLYNPSQVPQEAKCSEGFLDSQDALAQPNHQPGEKGVMSGAKSCAMLALFQLSMTTGLNRPNRLAQRRYPAQP